jgi:hypothetical protein
MKRKAAESSTSATDEVPTKGVTAFLNGLSKTDNRTTLNDNSRQERAPRCSTLLTRATVECAEEEEVVVV